MATKAPGGDTRKGLLLKDLRERNPAFVIVPCARGLDSLGLPFWRHGGVKRRAHFSNSLPPRCNGGSAAATHAGRIGENADASESQKGARRRQRHRRL